MTALEVILKKQIIASGPITVADYMATCLMHPKHGYYQQRPVFGAEGDFTTAPEISQMFGEMIGVWLMDRWTSMGKPSAFNIIEAGPGRGTLMADILRTAKALPAFLDAAHIHFIETSEQLRQQQKRKVPNAEWHGDFSALPAGPSLFVANEFFDALPIHQYIRKSGVWLEKRVGISSDALCYALTPATGAVSLISDKLSNKAAEDSVIEICPAAISIAGQIADHIKQHTGAALIIDYGYFPAGIGDTFQALEGHKYVDPLLNPGSVDLTAHVNFESLQQIALEAGLAAPGPVDQGALLMRLGIGARCEALATAKADHKQASLLSQLKRLTAPSEMGTLFKAMHFQSSGLSAAPGFGL